mgnify:FL=1
MAYKTLVLDLDGTLTNSEKKVSKKTKSAIMNIQDMGIRVILASGRSDYGMKHIANELELAKYKNYMISFNGARIRDLYNDELLYEQNIDPSLYPEIFKLWKEYKVNILTYNKEVNTMYTGDERDIYAIIDAQINNYIPLVELKNFEKELDFPVAKFLFMQDPIKLEWVEKDMQKRMGDKLDIYRSESCFLEVMPKGVNKGNALARLAKLVNLDPNEMIACGDSFNDISMIEFAGLGVAMEEAVDELKAAADYITKSNDDDGVVDVIEKFIINDI